MSFWGQKTFCLITGASRGIGRAIAIHFSKQVSEGSVFLLLARSQDALDDTKKAVEEASKDKCVVVTKSVDLAKPSQTSFLVTIKDALAAQKASAADFQHTILVHNAGSLGNVKRRVVEYEDLEEIQAYFQLNVSSMLLLTSQFFKVFEKRAASQRSVVQISSLAGMKSFKTWGYYSAGKASRDMLMKTLALEESDIQVLSWAPGPVETEMYEEASKETADDDLRNIFAQSREKGTVLSVDQTVSKLVEVLKGKQYTKGEHVDYFDIP